jgi:tRNA nucleotidyltransferase (CCA-adding enzyme)
VSPAFVEDPVRLLRLARLAARLDDFTVAPETRALLVQMVERGEVDALVPERVWQELSRGLMEVAPERLFEVLVECGALVRLMPELSGSTASPLGQGLPAGDLAVRWAALLRQAGLTPGQARQLSDRLRAPREARELAELTLRLAERLAERQPERQSERPPEPSTDRPPPPVGPEPTANSTDAAAADPAAAWLVDVLDAADAWRRPERFEALLQASAPTVAASTLDRLRHALAAARTLDLAAVTAGQPPGPALGLAIRRARTAAVATAVAAAGSGR